MTALHTYSYIVVDTQRGCHTLKSNLVVVWKYVRVGLWQLIWHWWNDIWKENPKNNLIMRAKFFFTSP